MKSLRIIAAAITMVITSSSLAFAGGQDCCKTASSKKSCSTDKSCSVDKAKAKIEKDKKSLKEDKAQK